MLISVRITIDQPITELAYTKKYSQSGRPRSGFSKHRNDPDLAVGEPECV
jgi:hypothetical protein